MKNENNIERLKSLIMSLMAVQADMRGAEKALITEAIASIRKSIEVMK